MKKKNFILVLIIIVSILIVIVAGAIVLLSSKEKNNTDKNKIVNNIISSEEKDVEYDENYELVLDENIKKVYTESIFNTIKQCINQYYIAIENQDMDTIKDLINSNQLNSITILQHGFEDFRPTQIYCKDLTFEKSEYFILGDVLWEKYQGKNSVFIVVDIDSKNNTFAVIKTNDSISNEEDYINAIKQTTIADKNSIVKNKNNQYTNKSMKTDEIIQYYIKDYTTMAIYYPEVGYSLLDDEYKNSKFSNINEYKEYIAKNAKKIENTILKKYGYEDKEEYLQYNVVDNNSHSYVIKRKSAMDYSVIADIYTIDIDSITEKYDSSDDEDKVAINIQKITEAINNQDYEYVYNKTSEQFKKQYSLDTFKNKFESILYGNYTESIENITQREEEYICEVKYIGESANLESINLTIVVKLKNDRNFEINFE